MKNCFKLILVVVVALLMQFDAFGQEITPNPRIQAQIDRIVSVGSAAENEEDLFSEISKLKEMEGNVEHLIQQLIYFRVNAMRMCDMGQISSDDMENAWGFSLIALWKILTVDESTKRLSSASAQSIVSAVLPYLGTENLVLKKQLHRFLKSIDYGDGFKRDYSHYESFVKEKKKNPPLPLIQYMYEKSPGEALLVMLGIYEKNPEREKAIIQAKETIDADMKNRGYGVDRSQAIEALEGLSRARRWWVRLYVAEIMQIPYGPARYYKNDAPEVFKRLKRDRSSVVRAVLKRPKEK